MEIREPERLTPVVGEADVIVVGSGPGGLSAAIAAARAGAVSYTHLTLPTSVPV